MPKSALLCRIATPFTRAGDIDEEGFRILLGRFIDNGIGVYIGSAGAGEGHALSDDELKRLYEIGVEECTGRVSVYANPPDQHTARATIRHSLIAERAGIETINVYPLAGWHGMRPTDAELRAYYENVLTSLETPVALAVQPHVGYAVKPAFIAEICERYPIVRAVNLTGVGDNFFLELKKTLSRPVELYVPLSGSLNTLLLGAAGLLGTEVQFIPKTFRKYYDLVQSKDFDGASKVYQDLKTFSRFVAQWTPSHPRWLKMALKVFKLPGGEGGLREPYQMPSQEEIARFTTGVLALGIAEIDEMARHANLL